MKESTTCLRTFMHVGSLRYDPKVSTSSDDSKSWLRSLRGSLNHSYKDTKLLENLAGSRDFRAVFIASMASPNCRF